MNTKFALLSVLVYFLQMTVISGQKPGNELLFNHALMAPESVEGSFHDLATYLKGPANSDKEVVETIFYWMAINITYYDDPSLENDDEEIIATTTLLTKKSGCEGTARLFYKLCTAAGVECVVIFGIANSYGIESDRSNSNHGWNAVKLDGKWELVDATWGGGGSTNQGKKKVYVKELDMRYLFADPDSFVIDHFPEQKNWQLLDQPISKGTFYSDFYDLKRMAKHTKYTN